MVKAVGIVCGDPKADKTQSGLVRVFIPGWHSNEFKEEDLTLCTLASSGDQEGQTRFSGGPEPGSLVHIDMDLGFNQTLGNGVITACIKDCKNQNQTLPGNFDIRSFELVAQAFAMKLPINSKAKAGSGEYNTKPTEEAGGEYYRDLTKALPASSTLWQIAGMKIPQSKAVPTAKQEFNNILSPAALGGLPGMALSLGSMFGSMPSEMLSKIFESLPPELGETMAAVINLMPEDSASGLSGMRVDPATFFANAVELLSQCRTTADIIAAIQELLSNTDLHGTENLGTVAITANTPFGNVTMSYDASGNPSSSAGDDIQKAMQAFSSLLTNTSGGFPSVFPDKNMWGRSSPIMGEMMKRLKPQEYMKAVQQAQKSIAPGTQPRDKINKTSKPIMSGENWLGKFLG